MDITKAEVLRVYGTHQAAADALGITRTAVTMWPEDQPIPERHALRLRYELRPDVFGDTAPASPEQDKAA
jgi:hypothetical protein